MAILKRLLIPSFSKLVVFFLPIIYQFLFWFVAITRGGVTSEAISKTMETAWTVMSFPGSSVCAMIPDCTKLHGDVFSTDPNLLRISHIIAYSVWYTAAAFIGGFLEALYKKFTTVVSSRAKIKPETLFILTVVGLFLLLYLFAFLVYRAYWYKVSGGKNISFEKHECVGGDLKIHLKNLGFEEVGLDEIKVFADKKPVFCKWEGDLSLGGSAVCTSSEPLGVGEKEHLPNWHDIEVKVPISTTGTAVYCD